jgi:hypothetical protein
MDGTFDQLAPVKRFESLSGKARFSYDLSAATDRLPIRLQIQIMEVLFGSKTMAYL